MSQDDLIKIVIPLVTLIIGYMLNWFKEHMTRKARREREDKLRKEQWEKERCERAEQWEREDRSRFLKEIQRLHADFLGLVSSLVAHHPTYIKALDSKEEVDEYFKNMINEKIERLKMLLGEIELTSSSELSEVASELVSCTETNLTLASFEKEWPEDSKKTVEGAIKSFQEDMKTTRRQFLEQAREELRISNRRPCSESEDKNEKNEE